MSRQKKLSYFPSLKIHSFPLLYTQKRQNAFAVINDSRVAQDVCMRSSANTGFLYRLLTQNPGRRRAQATCRKYKHDNKLHYFHDLCV